MKAAEAAKILGRKPGYGDAIWTIDHAGKWKALWSSNALPRCVECDARLEPLMRIGSNVDDWMFRECDACIELVCGRCSDEDDGVVTCLSCLLDGRAR